MIIDTLVFLLLFQLLLFNAPSVNYKTPLISGLIIEKQARNVPTRLRVWHQPRPQGMTAGSHHSGISVSLERHCCTSCQLWDAVYEKRVLVAVAMWSERGAERVQNGLVMLRLFYAVPLWRLDLFDWSTWVMGPMGFQRELRAISETLLHGPVETLANDWNREGTKVLDRITPVNISLLLLKLQDVTGWPCLRLPRPSQEREGQKFNFRAMWWNFLCIWQMKLFGSILNWRPSIVQLLWRCLEGKLTRLSGNSLILLAWYSGQSPQDLLCFMLLLVGHYPGGDTWFLIMDYS